MAIGGITFGAAKESLRMVTENKVAITSPAIMPRTNEAIAELLTATDPRTGGPLIPVNGMAIYDLIATDGFFTNPKELENVISIEVTGPAGTVHGGTDVRQGWYNLVNQFTYIDPAMQHDNPLVDFFLVPDADDPTILRRKYFYPGLSTDPTAVRVTGAKRYLPITTDSDYLIIQNVAAIKLMMQAIERRENNDIDNAKKYKTEAIEMLSDEVRKHLADPQWMMKRKGDYQNDITRFPRNSSGWMRGRLALEVPGAMNMGKSNLTWIMERAEERGMEMGTWKNCIEEFEATVVGGTIFFPARVESCLAIGLCGIPIPIRSIFFEYLEAGPGGWDCSCSGRLTDMGEEYFPNSGDRRRRYKIGGTNDGQTMSAVCKLRWLNKAPNEQMTIKNLEAMRLLCDMVINEQNEKWTEASSAKQRAKDVLNDELKEYLAGVAQTVPMQSSGCGVGDLGGVR